MMRDLFDWARRLCLRQTNNAAQFPGLRSPPFAITSDQLRQLFPIYGGAASKSDPGHFAKVISALGALRAGIQQIPYEPQRKGLASLVDNFAGNYSSGRSPNHLAHCVSLDRLPNVQESISCGMPGYFESTGEKALISLTVCGDPNPVDGMGDRGKNFGIQFTYFYKNGDSVAAMPLATMDSTDGVAVMYVPKCAGEFLETMGRPADPRKAPLLEAVQ